MHMIRKDQMMMVVGADKVSFAENFIRGQNKSA